MMEIAAAGKSSATKEQMASFGVVVVVRPLVALSLGATDAAEMVVAVLTETEAAVNVRVVAAALALVAVATAVVVAAADVAALPASDTKQTAEMHLCEQVVDFVGHDSIY